MNSFAKTLPTMLMVLFAGAAMAQADMAPVNDPPNPYQIYTGWANMPAGREWGATSAVDIDPDGKSIWIGERCGSDSIRLGEGRGGTSFGSRGLGIRQPIAEARKENFELDGETMNPSILDWGKASTPARKGRPTLASNRRFGGLLAVALPLLAACGETPRESAADFEEAFQTRLIEAAPGDIIEVPAGTHEITRSLSLTVPGVTIRGAGMDQSILSFRNQLQGAEGLLVTADDFTIKDLAIEDTVGDALKINNSANVTIRRVRTEWTNGPDPENGAYGIYPVQSSDILIDGSVAIGAADAGIYVGQSSRIIVRNSRAEYNVAGIEIENSTHADVHDNIAVNNTGGVLVFDLPNLEVQGGRATRVFNNLIESNNTPNFAPPGAIVGNVPAGTGLLVLANDDIEVFENRLADNNNVNIMVYSFVLGGREVSDPNYDPYPEQIYIHGNSYDGGGTVPAHALLAAWHGQTGENSPNIVWGGLIKEGASLENLICLGADASQSFMNLNGGGDPAKVSTDLTPHRCDLPRLPPVELEAPGS